MTSALLLPHPASRTPGWTSTACAPSRTGVLCLATAIVDHANRVRPNPGGLKVGGHQASSASIVSSMASLWFAELGPRIGSRPSRTPHRCSTRSTICSASSTPPYLTTLRDKCGLESYPSRSNDPHPVDYCTGSVSIGAIALISGATRRAGRTWLGAVHVRRHPSTLRRTSMSSFDLERLAVEDEIARLAFAYCTGIDTGEHRQPDTLPDQRLARTTPP